MPSLITQRPFTVRQAEARGITRQQLHRMVTSRLVRRVLTGVYVAADVPASSELLLEALALVVPADHVITDRTAALVHGVEVFSPSERGAVPRIETCALRGRHPTQRPQTRSGTRTLLPVDVMNLGSLLVTTPHRTALDLGCHLRRRDAMAAMNALARLHELTPAMLALSLPRYRGRRGVVQLRQLIPLVDGRIESHRESWAWLELADAGLPRPEPQHWIEIDGIPTYRLDFAYPHQRVAVEYDGEDFHASDEQKLDDEDRRRWLRRNGWTVVVVRKGDFTGRRLDAWVREVRVALRDQSTNRRW
ncbi:MAG TPA: DUF559 domain-containing protein [Nocardioides sp.]|nr:DUF559 domain-containing protein [Nocardioides sp.]